MATTMLSSVEATMLSSVSGTGSSRRTAVAEATPRRAHLPTGTLARLGVASDQVLHQHLVLLLVEVDVEVIDHHARKLCTVQHSRAEQSKRVAAGSATAAFDSAITTKRDAPHGEGWERLSHPWCWLVGRFSGWHHQLGSRQMQQCGARTKGCVSKPASESSTKATM